MQNGKYPITLFGTRILFEEPVAEPFGCRTIHSSTSKRLEKSKLELAKSIADNLVGTDALIDGPFESHRQTYADYAASGKAVKSIEDYLTKEVLPVYSNTHTSSLLRWHSVELLPRGGERHYPRHRSDSSIPLCVVSLHGQRCHSLRWKWLHWSH